MTIDTDIQSIKNRLFSLVETENNRVINRRVAKLEDALVDLQSKFFTQLANLTIGASGAPALGVYSPTWKPLSESYKRKKRRRGQAENEFYSFTGGLKQGLLRSKATTAFGKPLITIGSGGKFRKQFVEVQGNVGRSTTGRFVSARQIKELKRTIVVDLYPNVTENIRDGRIDEGAYFSDKVAIKMTNFRGGRDRPILVQFMNWWLDVEATRITRKILGVGK